MPASPRPPAPRGLRRTLLLVVFGLGLVAFVGLGVALGPRPKRDGPDPTGLEGDAPAAALRRLRAQAGPGERMAALGIDLRASRATYVRGGRTTREVTVPSDRTPEEDRSAAGAARGAGVDPGLLDPAGLRRAIATASRGAGPDGATLRSVRLVVGARGTDARWLVTVGPPPSDGPPTAFVPTDLAGREVSRRRVGAPVG